MDWRHEYPEIGDHSHSYRTVLPNQIVFDVGDEGDWKACRKDTHALWSALNFLGVPYWGSLSGGKGTHTELFGPAQLILPRDVRPIQPAQSKTDVSRAPPCVQQIHGVLATGGSPSHLARFTIASYFLHHGYEPESLVPLFSRAPNFDAAISRSQLSGMASKGYLPPSCNRMRAAGLCPQPDCRHGIRNPVSYGRKHDFDLPELELPPNETNDWRVAASRTILAVAGRFRNGDAFGKPPRVDALLVHPNPESRMLREFGSPKDPGGTTTKVLWTLGPSQFPPLPDTREGAYQKVADGRRGLPMPATVPHCDQLASWATGTGSCPQGPQCIPGPGNEGFGGSCADCPSKTR